VIKIAYSKPKTIKDYSNRKLTPQKHHRLRMDRGAGMPVSKVADKYGISESTVREYMKTKPAKKHRT